MAFQVDQDFDNAVFAIKPHTSNAAKACYTLLRDSRLIDGLRSRDRATKRHWRGYQVLLQALLGVALAHNGRLREARTQLRAAIDGCRSAAFTRSWSVGERRDCFKTDLAILHFLAGRLDQAHKEVRGKTYPPAYLMWARMMIEQGSDAEAEDALESLRRVHLGVYAGWLVDVQQKVYTSARAVGRDSRKFGPRLGQSDLGWWAR